MGTHPVSDSLRLNVSGVRPSGDMEYEGADAPSGTEAGGNSPTPAPKPEELGNSRGKRMAMKFVNKIASKEKYTQVGCPRSSDTIRHTVIECRLHRYTGVLSLL